MHITGTRQGTLRTNLPGVAECESFDPTPLSQIDLSLKADAIARLARCSRKIGVMEGMSRFVSNADMYLAMYVRKEALLSSQIEGTRRTFGDMFDSSNPRRLHAMLLMWSIV